MKLVQVFIIWTFNSLFKFIQDPSIFSGLMLMLLLPYENWCLHQLKKNFLHTNF